MHRTVPLALLAATLPLVACSSGKGAPAPAFIERASPALDALIPSDARLEELAQGFQWAEGPVWRQNGGYLLFTDVPKNTIYRWSEADGLSVFLRPSGHAGPDAPGQEMGSNGLTFDAQGRLVMADHGNRRVARLEEEKYTKTTLVDRYQGKRLNSPNDLIFHSNGDLYFTDPPYGLEGLNQSPHKELAHNGVYRLSAAGELSLVTDALRFPNGIALSPDERTLYVANSDSERPIWMAFDVRPDGSVTNGRVFFNASHLASEGKQGLPDGLAVDQQGNLFATGPGGVLVLSPDGRHLGTIATGKATANVAFGDDGSTLYITAHDTLLRIRTDTRGVGFPGASPS